MPIPDPNYRSGNERYYGGNRDSERLKTNNDAQNQRERHHCCDTLTGLLQPPLLVYQRRQCNWEFWVCIVLMICGWFPAILWAFHVEGIPFFKNLLCLFLPPLGLFCGNGGCSIDVLICCILTLFTVFGGVFWAYYKFDHM